MSYYLHKQYFPILRMIAWTEGGTYVVLKYVILSSQAVLSNTEDDSLNRRWYLCCTKICHIIFTSSTMIQYYFIFSIFILHQLSDIWMWKSLKLAKCQIVALLIIILTFHAAGWNHVMTTRNRGEKLNNIPDKDTAFRRSSTKYSKKD